jgi:hypothetical protein
MKRILLGFLVFSIALMFTGIAGAYDYSDPLPNDNIVKDDKGGYIVYPTENPDGPDGDDENVQWAAFRVDPDHPNLAPDELPTILLKATGHNGEDNFDFGEDVIYWTVRVQLQKNCILKGELASDGKTPLTVIENGQALFAVNMIPIDELLPIIFGDPYPSPPLPPLPQPLEVPAQADKVIIKDLISTDSAQGFCLAYAGGVPGNIFNVFYSEVEINNVHVINFKLGPPGPAQGAFAFGMQNVGKTSIKNCVVVASPDVPQVYETAIACIWFLPGFPGPESEITGNIVVTHNSGIGTFFTPSAIISNNIIENASTGIINSSDNSIITGNEFINITELGINVDGDSNIVEANEFELSNLTGLKGNGNVCILLPAALNLATGQVEGLAEDNYVKEQGNFPAGTGGALMQVLDGRRLFCEENPSAEICDGSAPNRVIGHPVDAVEQQKAAYSNILEKVTIAHDQEFPDYYHYFFAP